MAIDHTDAELMSTLQRMHDNSRSFLLAANRCAEVRRLPRVQKEEILIVPSIVCAAFSAEVALKGLALCFGIKTTREHNLAKLFLRLPDDQQQALIAFKGEPAARKLFLDRIEAIGAAFVEWRYNYESESLGISGGDLETLADRAQAQLESQLFAARGRLRAAQRAKR